MFWVSSEIFPEVDSLGHWLFHFLFFRGNSADRARPRTPNGREEGGEEGEEDENREEEGRKAPPAAPGETWPCRRLASQLPASEAQREPVAVLSRTPVVSCCGGPRKSDRGAPGKKEKEGKTKLLFLGLLPADRDSGLLGLIAPVCTRLRVLSVFKPGTRCAQCARLVTGRCLPHGDRGLAFALPSGVRGRAGPARDPPSPASALQGEGAASLCPRAGRGPRFSAEAGGSGSDKWLFGAGGTAS